MRFKKILNIENLAKELNNRVETTEDKFSELGNWAKKL